MRTASAKKPSVLEDGAGLEGLRENRVEQGFRPALRLLRRPASDAAVDVTGDGMVK
jgi:hypothetical protein